MGYRTGLLDIILEVPHELAHVCNFAPMLFEERIFVDAITVGNIIAEGIIEDTLFGPKPFVLAWPPVKERRCDRFRLFLGCMITGSPSLFFNGWSDN